MAKYIGNIPSVGEFKKLDSLTSTFNGSLTQFNLEYGSTSVSVGDASQLIVSLNGIIQEPLTAYTLAVGGSAIVFSSAPASTDTCHIILLGGVGGTSTVSDGAVTAAKLDAGLKDYLEETYSANGSQTTYTLTRAPIGTNDLMITIDGIVQPSTAYSVAGTTLTISPALPNGTDVRVVHMGVRAGFVVPSSSSITAAMFQDFTTDVKFNDNAKALFGTGDDLQIYHDGSNSYVKDAGTGNLNLQGENLALENTSGDNYFVGVNGSFVKIYYSGSEKLATTSSGIDVTGTVTSTGLIGNATNFDIRQNTSDGSDSKRTRIGGGGDVISSRGAMIEMSGNEHGNGGMLFLSAGHGGAYSQIRSYTSNIERMRIDASGNLLVGTASTGAATASNGAYITPVGQIIGRSDGIVSYLNRRSTDGQILQLMKDGTQVGNIQSRGGAVATIILDPRGNGSGLTGTTNGIIPTTQTGSPANNHVDLGTSSSNFRNAYLSGGVYLGGTGSANKLDDYEEGTWTPVLKASSGTKTWTYNGQAGYYRKVGGQVTVWYNIQLSSNGSGTDGNAFIDGLPFVSANNGSLVAHYSVVWKQLVETGDVGLMTRQQVNSATISILDGSSSYPDITFINTSVFLNDRRIRGTMTYLV